jgi:hypothetical protein
MSVTTTSAGLLSVNIPTAIYSFTFDYTTTYSTDFDEELSSTVFGEVAVPNTRWSPTFFSTIVANTATQIPSFSSGTNSQLFPLTTNFVSKATVWQAYTGNPISAINATSNPEIIYIIENRPQTWNGYKPAESHATTATQITNNNVYSTRSIAKTSLFETGSSSTENLAWVQQTTLSVTTLATSNVTTVNRNVLPNETGIVVSNVTSTTQQAFAKTLFEENTVTWTKGSRIFATVGQTTTTVASHTTGFSVVDGKIGNVNYKTTIQQTFAGTRTITTSRALTYTTSGESIIPVAGGSITRRSSFTSSIDANETYYGDALVSLQTVFMPGWEPQQAIYRTEGVIINEETGGWIVGNGTSIGGGANRISASAKRGGTTLRPGTEPVGILTVDSNSIYFTTSTSSETTTASTTASFVASASGESSTTLESRTALAPTHFGGGPFAEGATVVQSARAGVYKNRIDGATTSFAGGATVFAGGESSEIKVWWPVVALTPPINHTYNALTWTESRNLVQVLDTFGTDSVAF